MVAESMSPSNYKKLINNKMAPTKCVFHLEFSGNEPDKRRELNVVAVDIDEAIKKGREYAKSAGLGDLEAVDTICVIDVE